ncbi:hypothetical protein [Pseudoxanthomonas mexicana]
MLTEDSVVLITCDWLISQGWHIHSHCLGTSKGDDIVAKDVSGKTLLVECKGSVSPRTGSEFSGTYLWRSTSGALFNCLRAIERDKVSASIAIALPNVGSYQGLLGDMQDFFIRNNLLVFWVEPAGVVSVWQAGNSFKPVQLRGTA